ncbi:hypothetical protein C731_3785 [Mycolicibacterium hassiacum DSM 44199]|jgi:hypothetical protein|uniref:Uncharacterized protein n=1 Tax=Mycolicibacterium hassiacum (strain DSM 44199 / CIP 105218 / JCM 12690 / 3849) TaxID=1122247 RepID=K5B7P2_MYCHD|nr:EspA/EspE family type VII secretion system effector [Mycolicibacterium hassiacum]EKF22293.1 hypothetical protein C731_3785 [Mycolicibacterium hassiacum DSM 44199]MBX5485321.1 hypothetical protein [Mycolicibacterium hassiacum]MDA4087434.1 hypothetical protein [Mycolicibacterium hassiacum DSM 44199]VCT91941.1 hypothetical protein MHAS_03665 [Mycolicibacterium hassiacum DSM 44199]
MDVLGAFDAMWTSAHRTFGTGDPIDGTRFDAGPRLTSLRSDVDAARPGPGWSGIAADSYRDVNDAQSRVLGSLADLDRRLAAEVNRSAEVIRAGRRDLDAIRARVADAVAAVPPSAFRQQLLLPIVNRGLAEVAEVLERANRDLGVVAQRISALNGEYQALRPPLTEPAAGHRRLTSDLPATERTVPGTPVRPFEGVLDDQAWRIARMSPTLLDQWARLGPDWTFTSEPGGTYCDFQNKVINIDPSVRAAGPEAVVKALAHEIGHALNNPPLDRSSKEAYVNSRLAGEGAATMNVLAVEREILAAGGPDIVAPGELDDRFEGAYDRFLAAGGTQSAYLIAINEIGQIFGDLHPSTAPHLTYREYYAQGYR